MEFTKLGLEATPFSEEGAGRKRAAVLHTFIMGRLTALVLAASLYGAAVMAAGEACSYTISGKVFDL